MEKLDYLVLVNSDDSDILEFLEFLFWSWRLEDQGTSLWNNICSLRKISSAKLKESFFLFYLNLQLKTIVKTKMH